MRIAAMVMLVIFITYSAVISIPAMSANPSNMGAERVFNGVEQRLPIEIARRLMGNSRT